SDRRNMATRDSVGIRSYECPFCHTDLTASIRTHLYACALLPAEVRRRAQEARDAARHLVKQSQQLQDSADVLIREAEAALHALRATLRRPPARISPSETKPSGRQIGLLSYNVLPRALQVGDRFSDETGEWEVASRPRPTADGKSVQTCVRGIAEPALMKDRTWVATERIRVTRADQQG